MSEPRQDCGNCGIYHSTIKHEDLPCHDCGDDDGPYEHWIPREDISQNSLAKPEADA